MNLLKTQEFAIKFNLSEMDTTTWLYVVLVVLFFLVGLLFIWGKCWNKKWGVSTSVPLFVFSIILALLAAFAVFNLRGISRMEAWFDVQEETLAPSISDSPTFKREVFRSTWDQLSQRGGQQDLASPAEGGNELRLNNQEETMVLTVTAADETRTKLRAKVPFSLGIPLATKNSSDMAIEAIDAIQFDSGRYPVVVSPSNEWTKTVVKLQSDQALETAFASIAPAMGDLKQASLWALVLSAVFVLVLVPINALNDIKANPSKP